MQIKTATKEELGLLIEGLRSIAVIDQIDLQKKLLRQLENELTTRFGARLLTVEEAEANRRADQRVDKEGPELLARRFRFGK